MAVSADGRFLVSGSEDCTIHVWNIQERRDEFRLRGHYSSVNSVLVSPDCRFIVSGSFDKKIKIWNILERKEELTLPESPSYSTSLAVSADFRYIVSGHFDHTVKLWKIEEPREEFTFNGHTEQVCSVALTADSRLIISGSYDRMVKVWNTQERREEFSLTGHNHYVQTVAVSADCRFIVSGGWDDTIKIWNIQERREECTLIGHKKHIESVAVTSDCRFVVSASYDDTIKIWNIQERREECTFNEHRKYVHSGTVAVSTDNRFIVSGHSDGTTRLWNLKELVKEPGVEANTNYLRSAAMSADNRIAKNESDGKIAAISNVQEHREESRFSEGNQVQRVTINAYGTFVVCKEVDSTVKIWNVATKKKESFSFKRHQGLLKYIVNMFRIDNCKIVATPDLLILTDEFGAVRTAKVRNGDLQFSCDLGARFGQSNIDGMDLVNYEKVVANPTICSLFADRYSGILRFTLAHYFSYSGSKDNLKLLFTHGNFALRTDAFGKSPIYYAIVKKRQDCVEILLESIELMRSQINSKNYEWSLLAITNDFPVIMKNSPRQLNQLLVGLICSRELIYDKIPGDLPILQLGLTSNPFLSDFTHPECEDIPIKLEYSRIPLIGETGSANNVILLDGIINCKNTDALKTPIIRYVVQLQYNAIINWVIVYTFLLILNIVFLMLLIGQRSSGLYFLLPFLLANALLLAWETVEMMSHGKEYYQDYWNYLDIIRNIGTVIWIVVWLCGLSSLYFTWCIALINLLRGISVFRLFDGTRFYIQLIFRALNDIKYFFLMFAYSTFTFGFLLMISRDEELAFTTIWGDSYDINFGGYQDTGTGVYFMEYICYFGATVINVILMLNLLISILGNSYDGFQAEQVIVDIKEKAKISMELQSMMFWKNKQSGLKYVRLCNSAFLDGEEQDWEGRIRFMEKKFDKNTKELLESNKSIEKNISNSIASVEKKLESILKIISK